MMKLFSILCRRILTFVLTPPQCEHSCPVVWAFVRKNNIYKLTLLGFELTNINNTDVLTTKLYQVCFRKMCITSLEYKLPHSFSDGKVTISMRGMREAVYIGTCVCAKVIRE